VRGHGPKKVENRWSRLISREIIFVVFQPTCDHSASTRGRTDGRLAIAIPCLRVFVALISNAIFYQSINESIRFIVLSQQTHCMVVHVQETLHRAQKEKNQTVAFTNKPQKKLREQRPGT